MIFRIIGALLAVIGCGGIGILVARNAKKETVTLKKFILQIECWKNELSYHLTPLPELCRQASKMNTGILADFMAVFLEELERQVSPDAEMCIRAALDKFPDFPSHTRRLLIELGSTLGRFDTEGQLSGFESIMAESNRLYEHLYNTQEVRLRSYKTLGICAGVALVIIFI